MENNRFESMPCPCCDENDEGTLGRFIGILGGRDWYRCRSCGLMFNWFGEIEPVGKE